MLFEEKIYDYADKYSKPLPSYIDLLIHETAMVTVNPFMACGPVMGRFLIELSTWLQPKKIIEIGTFTGISALCLAEGLRNPGTITCIEVNEEYESIIRKYFKLAGKEHQLQLCIADALNTLYKLEFGYDLAFIDANKQFNDSIYELVLPLIRPGGTILVDNVLWYGNVLDKKQDKETMAIHAFNEKIYKDPRVHSFILPIRDGITILKKH